MNPRTQFWVMLMFGGTLLDASASAPGKGEEKEVLVAISQVGAYPGPDQNDRSGLVLWLCKNGRVLRALSPEAVGEKYVEGFVSASRREEWLEFLRTEKWSTLKRECSRQALHSRTWNIDPRGDSSGSQISCTQPFVGNVGRELTELVWATAVIEGSEVGEVDPSVNWCR